MSDEAERIIDRISIQTKILLKNHWHDIAEFRNGEGSIKVGFSSLIEYQGQERIIETTISFGKRVKDSTIDRIDTDQMALNLAPAPDAPVKRKRGRPKKNLLERVLTTAPSPDPVRTEPESNPDWNPPA